MRAEQAETLPSSAVPPQRRRSIPNVLLDHPAVTRLAQGNLTREELESALTVLTQAVQFDVRGALDPSRRLVELADARGWTDLAMHARLVIAEFDRANTTITDAVRATQEVTAWAVDQQDELLLASSYKVMAGVMRTLGDRDQALQFAILCLRHTPPQTPLWRRAVHTMCLGVALAVLDDPECIERLEEAYRLALAAESPTLALAALNNRAYYSVITGREDGPVWVARMVELSERTGLPMPAENTDTIARLALTAGDHDRVAELLSPLLSDLAAYPFVESDGLADGLSTYAESRRMLGDDEGAERALRQAIAMARAYHLTRSEADQHRELARLHAARGDHRTAYQELLAYVELQDGLEDDDRQARAAVARAMYETDEARRARDEFRELAWRDSLTGMSNRRHLDDLLPRLVEEFTGTGRTFALALLDLDHFKRINDGCSHAAGDEVLRRLAGLAEAHRPPGATMARIGGEEFVLLLPGVDVADAVTVVERLRSGVLDHAWTDVVGGLPVTLSAGVTAVRPGDDAAAVLARADRYLYAAKQAGRNRVLSDRDAH